MKTRQSIHILLLFILTLGIPGNSWALQSHGAPEGNYVHQMAHLLFTGALCYLYWHTRKTPELTGKGWKYLQIFCLLFALWNILAVFGHETFELLEKEDFLHKGTWKEQLAPPISVVKLIYFFTKMDHLIFVPALFALVMSLKNFYHKAIREVQK